MKQALFLWLVLGILGGCAQTEEAWVYRLEDSAGQTACLVAVAHLAAHPIQKSKRVDDCLSQAPVVAYETDPTVRITSIWQGYVREQSDPRATDLPQIALPKLEAALTAAGYGPQEIRYLRNLHPAAL